MASFSVPCPKSSAFSAHGSRQQSPRQLQQSKIVFSLSQKPSPSLLAGSSLDQPRFSRFQGRNQNQSTVLKAQANEVAIEKSSNSNSAPPTKLGVPSSDVQDVEPAKEISVQAALSDTSISAFMAEVANLVKLVDSRDIMELELKQPGCELIIRKKEAFPQPPTAVPVVMIEPSLSQTMVPSQMPAPQATSASSKALGPTPALALPAPAKSGKSSHPPLTCPMAGTFYRSPAPGEPPFVKVGDKVEKGKVICIIEAMKLMNEIEADQSGTVVEILVDDGKPVSVDMPLFIIEP